MANTDNYTKKDIIADICENTDITLKEAAQVVDCLMEQIMKAVVAGRNVELRNFGVFELQARKGRVGRNPNKPDKDIAIPDRLTVKFKAGKEFKEQVNKLDVKKFQK